MTIQELAKKYADWFETAVGKDDIDYLRLKKRDENISNLIYAAHDKMLPDDFKYRFIREALEIISESSEIEDIQLEADIYNSDLLKWIGSDLHRGYYVDQAIDDMCDGTYPGFFESLRYGQYAEKMEVLHSVILSLEKILEDKKCV